MANDLTRCKSFLVLGVLLGRIRCVVGASSLSSSSFLCTHVSSLGLFDSSLIKSSTNPHLDL